MTPQQFASELRPGNLLLIPDYEATHAERSPTGGFLMRTYAKVLRASEDIISNLTEPSGEREAYHPLYLREDAFRFLEFTSKEGIYSFQIPGQNVSISWTQANGVMINENGIPLKTEIRFAHQLQNHIMDTYGYDLHGISTDEILEQH